MEINDLHAKTKEKRKNTFKIIPNKTKRTIEHIMVLDFPAACPNPQNEQTIKNTFKPVKSEHMQGNPKPQQKHNKNKGVYSKIWSGPELPLNRWCVYSFVWAFVFLGCFKIYKESIHDIPGTLRHSKHEHSFKKYKQTNKQKKPTVSIQKQYKTIINKKQSNRSGGGGLSSGEGVEPRMRNPSPPPSISPPILV